MVYKWSKEILCHDIEMQWVDSYLLLGINFNVDLDIMVNTNFTTKLLEMEKVFTQYRKRKLSLLGKVTVIKTLAVPKLVYLLTVLPNPSNSLVKKIEDMFRNFIWDGKKPKLTLNQLEKDIKDGGLKLTNILSFTAALKMSWIKRLVLGEGDWQSIFTDTIAKAKYHIWEMDIRIKQQTNFGKT